jgi:hypothetical protein
LELRLLESFFPKTRLMAFRDVGRHLPEPMQAALKEKERPLDGKVLAISFGYSPQLADETDLGNTGYTSALVPTSRLYNPSAWPRCDLITAEDEAAWINTCSILRVIPKDAGLAGQLPDKALEPDRFFAWQAIVLSQMRRWLAKGFDCPIPRNATHAVKPTAFVFLGGKVSGFSGVMPGILEEFLRVTEQKLPVYLLGGFGGAAGIIAHALSTKAHRPAALTAPFYSTSQTPDYKTMLEGFEKMDSQLFPGPDRAFDELWKVIQEGRETGLPALLRNGLDAADNKELITTTDTMNAVHLVWRGLNRLFFES